MTLRYDFYKGFEIILFGQKSPYVYLLQGILAQLSADYETIRLPALTGTLDANTSDALRAFQVLADLPPTGTLDRITWKHLSRQFTLSAARNTSKRTNNRNSFANYYLHN